MLAHGLVKLEFKRFWSAFFVTLELGLLPSVLPSQHNVTLAVWGSIPVLGPPLVLHVMLEHGRRRSVLLLLLNAWFVTLDLGHPLSRHLHPVNALHAPQEHGLMF
jgi:hypothetical protein